MEKRELRAALDRWRDELIGQRTAAGHWTGQLAPSALSTATAVSALASLWIDADRRSSGGGSEGLATDSANGTANPYAPPLSGSAGGDGRLPSQRLGPLVRRGTAYLRGCQNTDGGFGDTDRSRSNIATTLLALAAWRLAAQALGGADSGTEAGPSDAAPDREATARAEAYVQAAGGWAGLRARYGRDKTFVVPILTNCAIAGMVAWSQVPRLPFEAAVFPQSMYRFLRMPVVSYAIPALVAIGQARHFLGPRAVLPVRLMRRLAVARTMRVLRRMQPDSGGYLEATPLTSFVLMSLAATGRGDCEVAQHCSRFLAASMAEDGSWPIDTNLATWVTSLAVHGLSSDPADQRRWASDRLVQWLLDCQHTLRHPFTGADPGGWGWTDLSGAVPDGDDTPAAILALHRLRMRPDAVGAEQINGRIGQAIAAGQQWLLGLQNRDGGWPTFCRGWGRLPFDRSSVDLTAHALRALNVEARGGAAEPAGLRQRIAGARVAGWRYLQRQQRDDGSWLPLWFGNQDCPNDENPIYGTARVLLALGQLKPDDAGCQLAGERGAACLLRSQNPDGGWGGGPTLTEWLERQGHQAVDPKRGVPICSSIEETAVAVEGLSAWLAGGRVGRAAAALPPATAESGGTVAASGQDLQVGGEADVQAAILRGVRFLDRAIQTDRHRVPWPIGFYFAKLWYHEKLYPAVFATAALALAWDTLFAEEEIDATAGRAGDAGG